MINQRLEELDQATIQDMKHLQNSDYSLRAENGLPIMLTALQSGELSSKEAGGLEMLQDWDLNFSKDAKAPVLFTDWLNKAYRMTFDEILALDDSIDMLYPEVWRLFELIDQQPEHAIFDIDTTSTVETAGDVLTLAYQKSWEKLAEKLEDPDFNWAAHKRTRIGHLAGIPAFTEVVKVGGYSQAPNAIGTSHGPSWRMIVELGEEIQALGVYPGGQSGNPGSRYYRSMIDTWVNGEYYELFFMKSASDDRQEILFEFSLE